MTQANRRMVRSVALVGLLALANGTNFAQIAAPQIAEPKWEDFDRVQKTLPDGWSVVSGDWRVEQGTLVVDSLNSEAYVTFGETSWQNYYDCSS